NVRPLTDSRTILRRLSRIDCNWLMHMLTPPIPWDGAPQSRRFSRSLANADTARRHHLRRTRMTLLLYYVALVFAFDLVAVAIGSPIERTWPAASLPAFIAMYFLILWAAWMLPVRLPASKAQNATAAGPRP